MESRLRTGGCGSLTTAKKKGVQLSRTPRHPMRTLTVRDVEFSRPGHPNQLDLCILLAATSQENRTEDFSQIRRMDRATDRRISRIPTLCRSAWSACNRRRRGTCCVPTGHRSRSRCRLRSSAQARPTSRVS